MTRFVTDSSLDYVARRLRFLGYDVVTLAGARLEELFDVARRDGRLVLTLSARHPKAFGDVGVMVLPRGDAEAAVRAIAGGHEPAGAPFSRCPADNTALQRRLPMEAMGEVPGRVLRRAQRLDYCPTCGKWYWDGSHVAHVREWLERVLGRPIESPPPDPPAITPSSGETPPAG